MSASAAMAVSLSGTQGTSPANFSTTGWMAPVSWPLSSFTATKYLLSATYSSMIERAVSLTTKPLSASHVSRSALVVECNTAAL